jgi:hypothetical protein
MLLAGLLGLAAFSVTSFVVGFRLLALGSRTRQVPELTIGASFVLGGGIACVLSVVAAWLELRLGAPFQLALGASTLALHAGVGCLGVFTWRVFRPGDRWAAVLFGVCAAGLALGFLGRLATGDFTPDRTAVFEWVGIASRVLVYAWALTETLREYRAARRRCAIGLADPLVANRFLLWGIGLAAILAVWLYAAALLATGRDVAGSRLLVSGLGFVCALSLWLAFFPPAAYRSRFAAAGS